MSDIPKIMEALAQLGGEPAQLRTELMGRLDRLQDAVTTYVDDLFVSPREHRPRTQDAGRHSR